MIQQPILMLMEFPERLATLRKDKKMTQQVLADKVGVHVIQIRRYEAGDTQPTLEVIKKIAIALSVSADLLIFDKDERGPSEDLRLQFEAVASLSAEEQAVVKEVIEGLIIKYQSRRWDTGRGTSGTDSK